MRYQIIKKFGCFHSKGLVDTQQVDNSNGRGQKQVMDRINWGDLLTWPPLNSQRVLPKFTKGERQNQFNSNTHPYILLLLTSRCGNETIQGKKNKKNCLVAKTSALQNCYVEITISYISQQLQKLSIILTNGFYLFINTDSRIYFQNMFRTKTLPDGKSSI